VYLTKEEDKMYSGEYGWAYEVSMKILVHLGDLFKANRLIPIKSAHISGVSYKNVGDATVEFLETLSKSRCKVRVYSTLNPSSFDRDLIHVLKVNKTIVEKQERIINAYKTMGVNPTFTCTPYYIKSPRPGQHLAWSESSAVVYSNSVLGAWTNREGGPSALAAALVGKTPDYGIHQPENRRGSLKVKIKVRPRDAVEFGAIGVHVGKFAKDKIPIFSGLRSPSEDELKQLSAGLASSGMVPAFHLRDFKNGQSLEEIEVDWETIKNAIESLSTTSKAPDLIFIGCPHCSLSELKEAAEALKGVKVKRGRRLWICTSRYIKNKAKRYVDAIEKAGAKVICDTCAIVTWLKNIGVDTMMTNSAKAAFYAPSLAKVDVCLRSLRDCIKFAAS
jgi:predicted aconitase